MNATEEQIAICASNAPILLVSAGAGTGKTSTLVRYAQERPRVSMLYLAFNRTVREEASKKFPSNVKCVTTHALAYPRFGAQYQHKLGNPKAFQFAQALAIPAKDAGIALNVVNNFLTSAHREIEDAHTFGLAVPKEQRDYIVKQARRAWEMMRDTQNSLCTMPHDGYLKLYQLSNPVINTEVILFDEAQDANPVTLAIVEAQKSRKVFVGDSRQSIYGFRGAVNAMERIKADEHLHLTASFRYGDGVARLANTVLGAYSDHPKPLRGLGKHKTVFAVDRMKPHTVLSRTNAALFAEAVSALEKGVPFSFVGGIANYKFDNILDAYHLFANQRGAVKDKMIQSFENYGEFVEYGKAVDDKEINSLVRIVEEYGQKIPTLIDRIQKEAVEQPTGKEIQMTTAHKAKGLEWMDVVLTDDFTDMQCEMDNDGESVPPEKEEINLLYVALTRALRGIDVHPSLVKWLSGANPALAREVKRAKWEMSEHKDATSFDALIVTARENKSLLAGMGIEAGAYDDTVGGFPAVVSKEALAQLRQFPADFKVSLKLDVPDDLVDEPAQQALAQAAPEPKPKENIVVAVNPKMPLYDNDGFEHRLVTFNGREIVTAIGGTFVVWDARDGVCLKKGCEAARLGNNPLKQATPTVEAYQL